MSLRDYDGLYTDLVRLRSHLDKGRHGVILPELTHKSVLEETVIANLLHVTICLLAIYKEEGGVNYHTINVANESMSGSQTRWWIGKMVSIADQDG